MVDPAQLGSVFRQEQHPAVELGKALGLSDRILDALLGLDQAHDGLITGVVLQAHHKVRVKVVLVLPSNAPSPLLSAPLEY